MKDFQPSRRDFLKIVGGMGVALLGTGAAGKALPAKKMLRPPGGQQEDDFLSRCLRCDRCRSICPTKVICLANVRDGLVNARTPVLNFHQGICDFCSKCMEVCPSGALQFFDPQRDKLGQAEIQPDICLAYDSRGCRLCVDACPYGAISLDAQNLPVVDKEKCNGCGVCENVCPALVLHGFSGSRTQRVRGIKVEVREGGEDK